MRQFLAAILAKETNRHDQSLSYHIAKHRSFPHLALNYRSVLLQRRLTPASKTLTHFCSAVGVEGRAATGSEGGGETPLFDWTGDDSLINLTSIIHRQEPTFFCRAIPLAKRAAGCAATPTAVNAGPGPFPQLKRLAHA
jgi:hypothetical protein